MRRCYFEAFDRHGACDIFRQLMHRKRQVAHELERFVVSVDNKVGMFSLSGLDQDIDEAGVLLTAVYLQQKGLQHKNIHIGSQIRD